MRKNRLITLFVSAGAILLIAGTAFAFRQDIRDALAKAERGPLPTEIPVELINELKKVATPEPSQPAKLATGKPKTAVPTTKTQALLVKNGLPTQMNLKIPFFPQAPFRVWDEIHEDACEEASILMIQAYLDGEKTVSLEEVDRRILELVEYQNEKFGDFKSTDAEQTATMMREHLGLTKVTVLPVESASDIRAQLSKGRPVVIPAAGRLLKNPNFRHGGPLYHMLLIKGYTTDGRFVTHDPGTRLGENYVYDEAVIMESIHDYNGGDVLNGRKVMIIVE